MDGTLRYLMMAAAVAVNLALALASGSLASQVWLQGRHSAWQAAVLAQGRGTRKAAFVLGLAGLLASAWFEAAAMAETPLLHSGPAVAALLLRTHFGHAWLVGIAAWSLACLAPQDGAQDGIRPIALATTLAALAIFVATRSVVSHAAAGGDLGVDVAIDGLHLALVSLWAGIVIAGARLALPPQDATRQARADATCWVQRMSSTATAALLAIAATGLFKVWRALAPVSSISGFMHSYYAHALAAKLGLIAVAVVLGGLNRFVVMPRLLPAWAGSRGVGAWRQRLLVILRLEAATLMLVLVTASLLSGTEPPDAS